MEIPNEKTLQEQIDEVRDKLQKNLVHSFLGFRVICSDLLKDNQWMIIVSPDLYEQIQKERGNNDRSEKAQ